MKLICCYIENFGKLSGFSYNFNNTLNLINQPNGYGKTTFSTFIKSMLFGLEYKTGKSVTERKYYKPWNGGKFGGSLTLELNNKTYKIERFFGTTDKKDSFILYNLDTNLESNDFSKNIGTEIFGIDRDSYEKTAFITLKDNSLLNDIISQKLGNIIEQEKDIDVSSSAIKLLDDTAVKIIPKRGKNGLIGNKEEQIVKWKQQLREYEYNASEIVKKENQLNLEQQNSEKINKEIQKLETLKQSLYLQDKKCHYNKLCEDYYNLSYEVENLKSFFSGTPYSDTQVLELENLVSSYTTQLNLLENQKLNENDSLLLQKLSDKFVNFSDTNNNSTKQHTLSKNLQRNSTITHNNHTDYELQQAEKALNSYKECLKIDKQIDELKQSLNNSKTKDLADNHSTRYINPVSLTGTLLLICGIAIMFFTQYTIISTIFCITAVLIILFSVVKIYIHNKTALTAKNASVNNINFQLNKLAIKKAPYVKNYEDFLNIIIFDNNTLQKNLTKNNQDITDTTYTTDILDTLIDLQSEAKEYCELQRKTIIYNDTVHKFQQTKTILDIKLSPCYLSFPPSVTNALSEIKERLTTLKLKEDTLNTKILEKTKFEAENNIDFNNLSSPDKSMEELNDEHNELLFQMNNSIKQVIGYQKDIDTLTSSIDEFDNIQELIANAVLEIDELNTKWKYLELTKQCLETAKNSLAIKYMSAINKAFNKYLKLLSHEYSDFHVDIHLNVSFDEYGERQESSSLSKGLKDLIQICLRMALIEAVFEHSTAPVLILDDPFVNLDEDKIEKSKILLSNLCQKYQVIYFTCHESRAGLYNI